MTDRLDELQRRSYAAANNVHRTIDEQRFKELCQEVKDEGNEPDRPNQLLIKLRAELGFRYPRITLPDIPSGSVVEAYLDEVYRLMMKHMEPTFDVESAINNDLLWGKVPGYEHKES